MKPELRKLILNRRNALSVPEAAQKSNEIFQRLQTTKAYQEAHRVMLYLSIGKEVQTSKIVEDLLLKKKRVFIPATQPAAKEMLASELLDPAKDLTPGYMNIPEPKKEALRPISPMELDLVLVPGLAFDLKGYRIGYGGGYYDRFLPKLAPHAMAIGLAYRMQIVDNAFPEAYDIPVSQIVTEKEVIRTALP